MATDGKSPAAERQSQPDHERPLISEGVLQTLALLPPAARLTLRRHPIIVASMVGDLLVRAVRIARDIDLGRGLHSVAARALNLAIDLDMARARSTLDLEHDSDSPLGLAHVFADSIVGDLHHVSGIRRNRGRNEVRGVDRDPDRSLSRARSSVYLLVRTLAFSLDLVLNHADDVALDRARHLARACAAASPHALSLDLARRLAHDLDQAAGYLVGLPNGEGIGAALLMSPLDDFTSADLREVDLQGIDLTGVRWTLKGTRWPPVVDVDRLRNDSEEAGSGVYVVVGHGLAVGDLTRT